MRVNATERTSVKWWGRTITNALALVRTTVYLNTLNAPYNDMLPQMIIINLITTHIIILHKKGKLSRST